MEPATQGFSQSQLQGKKVIAQVVLRLTMGDRYFGTLHPDISAPIGTVTPAGGRTFTASDFTSVPVIERSARLLDLPPLTETSQPSDGDVLGSWGQGARTTMSFELDNTDGLMSKMVGEEYMLNKQVALFVGFAGLGWDYAQLRFLGQITRVTLKRRSVRIEAEAAC